MEKTCSFEPEVLKKLITNASANMLRETLKSNIVLRDLALRVAGESEEKSDESCQGFDVADSKPKRYKASVTTAMKKLYNVHLDMNDETAEVFKVLRPKIRSYKLSDGSITARLKQFKYTNTIERNTNNQSSAAIRGARFEKDMEKVLTCFGAFNASKEWRAVRELPEHSSVKFLIEEQYGEIVTTQYPTLSEIKLKVGASHYNYSFGCIDFICVDKNAIRELESKELERFVQNEDTKLLAIVGDFKLRDSENYPIRHSEIAQIILYAYMIMETSPNISIETVVLANVYDSTDEEYEFILEKIGGLMGEKNEKKEARSTRAVDFIEFKMPDIETFAKLFCTERQITYTEAIKFRLNGQISRTDDPSDPEEESDDDEQDELVDIL